MRNRTPENFKKDISQVLDILKTEVQEPSLTDNFTATEKRLFLLISNIKDAPEFSSDPKYRVLVNHAFNEYRKIRETIPF